ncbi:hypothetical protein GCM10009780_26560 [Actinomadura alba]
MADAVGCGETEPIATLRAVAGLLNVVALSLALGAFVALTVLALLKLFRMR